MSCAHPCVCLSAQLDYENAYIYKIFALHFVNRFSALLYAIFWLQDLSAVRALLISMLTTSAVSFVLVNSQFTADLQFGKSKTLTRFSTALFIDVGLFISSL